MTDNLFFALLRAGLWGGPGIDDIPVEVDWKPVFALAKEQTVVGLISDGVTAFRRSGVSLPMDSKVTERFMVQTVAIEMANARLNGVVARLAGVFKENGITYCLVKGQGTAQNYPCPAHRSPGDIDFLLDDRNYRLAVEVLSSKADKLFPESPRNKHLGMLLDGGVDVELHGTIRAGFGKKYDLAADSMQDKMFRDSDFRLWNCLGIDVPLPSVDFDAVFIFAHFIQHFYHGGLGLRQICDWAMHLHRFASEIDWDLVKSHLKALGMEREWKAFGYLAVNSLGLPESEMPFYDGTYARHADRIWNSMALSGNFGKKMNEGRNVESEPYLLRKSRSLIGHFRWIPRHFALSPHNTIRALSFTLAQGVSAAFKGL